MLLVVIAALGIWLVVTGGQDAADPPGTQPRSEATLPATDTDSDTVAALAGLALPASTGDFLTARLDDGSQLDITLTIDPGDEQDFVSGSGLPTPKPSERFITHSSPLWVLNPEAPIRGTQDTYEGLTRQAEFHDEDGRVRARIVIRPSS